MTGLAALFAVSIALGALGSDEGAADPTCPDTDQNNTPGTAEPLSGLASDRSLCDGEEDWFSVSVEAGDAVAVDLFADAGADLDVALHDGSGPLVMSATAESPESIRYTATASGDLLVRVFESTAVSAKYAIAASAGPASPCGGDEDAFEPNDDRTTATPVGATPALVGWVCDGPDVFEVHVPAGSSDPLAVTMTVGAQAGDLDVGLFDDEGAQVDVSTGTGSTEEVGLPAPVQPGSYFVEVFGHRGGSGGYELELSGVRDADVLTGLVTAWDRESYSEQPAGGVAVGVHPVGQEGALAEAETDSSGGYRFTMTDLDAGDHRVRFADPDGSEWVPEWYRNQSGHGTAEDVTITAWQTTTLDPVLMALALEDEPFPDIPSSFWAYDGVRYLWTYRLVDGMTGGNYLPGEEITRGQLTRMLYRMAGSPEPCDPNYVHPFTDATGTWINDAVTWATCDPAGAEPAIAVGTTSTTFEPGTDINRAQAIRMLYRLAGALDTTGLPAHGLNDVPQWVAEAVTWAAWDPNGSSVPGPIITGIGGNFAPRQLSLVCIRLRTTVLSA